MIVFSDFLPPILFLFVHSCLSIDAGHCRTHDQRDVHVCIQLFPSLQGQQIQHPGVVPPCRHRSLHSDFFSDFDADVNSSIGRSLPTRYSLLPLNPLLIACSGPVLLVVASLSSAAVIAVSFSHNIQPFVLPQDFYSHSNKIKELVMKRLDPRYSAPRLSIQLTTSARFIAVVIVMVRWVSRLRQRAQASALFKYHEFPFESGYVIMGEEMPRERQEALRAEDVISCYCRMCLFC